MSTPSLAARTDAFHAHLDGCERCRTKPLDLCPTGAALLMASALKVLHPVITTEVS